MENSSRFIRLRVVLDILTTTRVHIFCVCLYTHSFGTTAHNRDYLFRIDRVFSILKSNDFLDVYVGVANSC